MKERPEIEFDGVDLLLLAATVVLAIVTLFLPFPGVWAWCLGVLGVRGRTAPGGPG